MADERRVLGIELFPDLSEEIDRRIMHSETRIKYWVVGGVLVHLLTLAISVIPVVFYLGQISRDISDATNKVNALQVKSDESNTEAARWIRDRMAWEASIEQWAASKGYHANQGVNQ